MLVDTTYYVVSLIKVFSAATFLIVVLPLIMWHNYLKTKPYSYRFMFCIITQSCFLINLVLLLGFFNICNRFTVSLGILSMFFAVLWGFSDRQFFPRSSQRLSGIKQFFYGERKLASVRRNFGLYLARQVRMVLHWPLWRHILRHLIEYLVLAAAVVYNIWFLTHNVLIYHSYQFSDIPVHQSWIYMLSQGELFGDGIYPFGMHAIVYLIHTLFFLDLREVLLYFGAFQTVLLLICVYFLSGIIIKWKYASFIVLISFSLFLDQGRYAAALPQECGMFAVALMAYFLIKFLNTPLERLTVAKDGPIRRFLRVNQYLSRRYLTTDALLFALCVALSIEFHFYTAIAACLFVVSILLAYLIKTVRKQYLVPIIACGLIGVVIALTPFAACLAKGIPFQESMQWAMSVITGEDWVGSESNYREILEASTGEAVSQDNTTTEDTADSGSKDSVQVLKLSFAEKLRAYYDALYDFSDVCMFGGVLTDILVISLAVGLCGAVGTVFRKKTRSIGMGYGAVIFYIVLMSTMGASQTLGIVEIIAAARASTFGEPFIGIAYAIPVDIVFTILCLYRNKIYRGMLSLISVAGCFALVVVIFRQGLVHKFFDVNLAYYNEPEYLTRHIREEFEADTFTVVATTPEYYEVVDYGYHENLSKFMNMVNGNEDSYTIPTPYVFIFVEKHVLQDYYYGDVDVSLELAGKDFVYFESNQDYYFQRAILESQAYYWALKFMEMYPNSMKIYFQDDIYIAYVIEQNPYSLYDFQIDYLPDEGALNEQ